MNQFLSAHVTEIAFILLYASTAAISVLPKPGDPRPWKDKVYESAYDFLHLLANKAAERKPGSYTPPQISAQSVFQSEQFPYGKAIQLTGLQSNPTLPKEKQP